MRFISFVIDGRASYGIVNERGVHDLGARFGSVVPDLKSYLKGIELGLLPARDRAQTADYRTDEITYLPPIPEPGKIICVGLNYEGHRLETGRPKNAHPTLFARFADTLVAHGEPIVRPPESQALDFEAELAVIIGRSGRRVPKEKASSFIAGYSCFNDGSLRDYQNHTHQFMPGKNFVGTGAFGPDMVTADEISDLAPLRIEMKLNGEVLQSALLEELIFSIEDLIVYITQFTPLSPGDVLVTGTPGGVGFKRNPPLFMKPGDVAEVVIDKIGSLRNDIVEEVIEG